MQYRSADISLNISRRNEFLLLAVLIVFPLMAFASGAFAMEGISEVTATDKQIKVEMSGKGRSALLCLAEPCQGEIDLDSCEVLWRGRMKSQTINLPRFDNGIDRIYSKYVLFDKDKGQQIGNSKYVANIKGVSKYNCDLPWPKGIKGVSCIVGVEDAIELGTKYVHDNIYMQDIIDLNNPDPEMSIVVEGQKIGIKAGFVRALDAKYKSMTDGGISVIVVFLNKLPEKNEDRNVLIHPDSDIEKTPTHHGAFNLTSKQGLIYYIAALEFLANRYTNQQAEHGLISGFIIGNELQQHWVWYNMGAKKKEVVEKEYLLAVRMAYLATQKYNKSVRVFVSMDHHWTKRGYADNPLREIRGDELIVDLNQMSKQGGDFPWNVAYHPYPDNLFDPRFWLDKNATYDFGTKKITFKNIEVLVEFLKQKELQYKNKTRRIIFSEQGFNTPDCENGEEIQAAAYAYAYYKISHMPNIDAFILHRHVDHRDEGGLKLGLWTCSMQSEEPCIPESKKYIWNVFKHADQSDWKSYFEFAKPIIGISDWAQALPRPSNGISKKANNEVSGIVFDLIKNIDRVKFQNINYEKTEKLLAAGWMVPAVSIKSIAVSKSSLEYSLNVPEYSSAQDLFLKFALMTNEVSSDLEISLSINGKELWKSNPDEKGAFRKIKLSDYSGKTIIFKVQFDGRKGAEIFLLQPQFLLAKNN